MKILVVGAGSIGRRHLRNLLALDVDAVAVCETDAGARERATREFGVAGFARLGEALDTGPDAVLVCTPTHLHVPVARTALEAGAHVFIEKPISASREGTADLIATAAARRRKVLVACNMRFHPGLVGLKAGLEAGTPGHPLYFRARFSHYVLQRYYRASSSARREHDGSFLLEGVHEIDYLRWLGGEVAWISAYAHRLGGLEIDTEDYVIALLGFKSGAAGQIHLDCLSPLKLRGCEVVGVDGTLLWSSEGKEPERVRVTWYDADRGRHEDVYTDAAYDGNRMYVEEMRHFLDCVSGATAPALDLEQAVHVLALALEARAAAEQREAGQEAALPLGRVVGP